MAVVGDQHERAAILEALANMNQRAKREFPVVGTPELPTPWDRRHGALDDLLTLLEACD